MSEQSHSEQQSFVELNRRFRKLEQKAKAEEAAVESYTTSFVWQMGGLSWDDLLKENRAVVLGEPGSGKSWELRESARLLNGQGEFAFLVRLDQLVERELPKLFDGDEQSRFNRWKQSQNAAYFFLDSVDEAKFRKISDFHATLNSFRNELGSDLLLRTKIFLSSRISEWKPLADGFEFQRLFPLPPVKRRTGGGQSKEIEKPKPEFLVVQLEPLDRNQVERFAGANGVSDVQVFAQALDRAFAWEFARRPLDVADLIGFWNENGRIGSLTELIEFDVSSKLRPREGRDEFPLSEAEGREGAEWLAATSVFSRKFSFGVPDDGSTNADSLNPRACLPSHWRDDQTRALLNRAIFDSAVYGHFRFHHRRVGEYLAAKWIAARMEKGCPQHVLEQLLVEVVRGCKVLRPSLRSVAAWLCCGSNQWNQLARSLVVETDPGIHLQYGVWMQIDGDAAVTYLASILKNVANPDDIVVRLCSILSGEEMEGGPFVANPNYLRPVCLRRFIPLVYQHVRFSDDLDRSGGGYSPTARDHAQRFRSTLPNRLENDEDSTATEVLRELADDPAMSQVRDWILNLLDKRLVNGADSEPWTPSDIREFAEHHEVDPKNGRELFAIARKRLQVLKRDVEQSDNSARTELHKEYPEMELRRWLQRRLIERSQARYTIPQEAEIDRQERPDLRLENPKTGPVSIEVKWADSWTLPQLLERLENQLVGQYLRAHNSRYGIYFLGFIGKKQNWEEPTTGKYLTFAEVVELVSQRATALMRSNPKIAGLEVVSINFCEPKRT